MKIEEALYEKVIYEKKFPKWEMPSDEELAEDKVDADEPKERLTFEQIMEKIYKDVTYVPMPEDLAFFGRKDNEYDIVMSLDFYTHTVYRNGRQENP